MTRRTSLVQAHQMRVNAAQADTHAATTEAIRAQRWLLDQRQILAGIKSTEAKEAHKAQALPEILPYLQGVLQGGSGAPDPVVSHCAVWAIDAGDWSLSMQLAAYVVRHDMPMPDEFQRNAPTTVVDMLANAALTGRMRQTSPPAPELLGLLLSMTAAANMPDQTRAKNHKAIAYAMAGKTTRASEPGDWSALTPGGLKTALHHLTEAERLDEKSGVKKDILAVQKLLKADEPGQPTAAAEPKKPSAKKAPAKRTT